MIWTPTDPPCDRCRSPKSEHTSGSLICRGWGGLCRGGSFRRPVAAMPRDGVAPHPGVPLGLYRHFKGEFYVVTGGTFEGNAEDDVVAVSYYSLTHGYRAHRPAANFLAKVLLPSGAEAPRFLHLPYGDPSLSATFEEGDR